MNDTRKLDMEIHNTTKQATRDVECQGNLIELATLITKECKSVTNQSYVMGLTPWELQLYGIVEDTRSYVSRQCTWIG